MFEVLQAYTAECCGCKAASLKAKETAFSRNFSQWIVDLNTLFFYWKIKKKINTEDTPSPRKLFSVNSCCFNSVQRDKVELRALGTTEELQGLNRSGWLMSTCWLCWLRLMPGASPAHLQQIPVAALLGSRAKTKEWEYHSSPCPPLLQELPWDRRFQGLGGIWRIPNPSSSSSGWQMSLF